MTHGVLAGGLHDLAQADAHALPLVALVRAKPLLQDGDDLWQDLLPQLPHQVAQCPSSDLEAPPAHTHTDTHPLSHHLKTNRPADLLLDDLPQYRSLVGAGGGQEAQQQGEKGGQDLTQRPGRVRHHDLPHVEGRLPHHQLRVGAAHVEA